MDNEKLLHTLTRMQRSFLNQNISPNQLFADVMEDLLSLTGSEIGIIFQVSFSASFSPALQFLASKAQNIPKSDFIPQNSMTLVEQAHWLALFEPIFKSPELLISNHIEILLPHQNTTKPFPIHSLVAIPLVHQNTLIGIVTFLNRKKGFDKKLVDFLEPMFSTLTLLMLQNNITSITPKIEDDSIQTCLLQLSGITLLFEKAHHQIKYLFENNPTPMWVFDEHTLRFLDVNKAAIEHYGYTKEEFLEMTLFDVRPKEEHNSLEEYHKQGNPDLTNAKGWKHQKKNGEIIEVELTNFSITYQDKKAKFTHIKDVTNEINNQNELKRREAMLKAIFDASVQYKFLLDKEMNILQYNKPAEERLLLRFDKQVTLGESILNYILDDRKEKVKASFESALRGKHSEYVSSLSFPNQGTVWMKVSFVPVYDDKSEIIGVMFNILDISHQKLIEKRLQYNQTLFKAVFDNSVQSIYVLDVNCNILIVNQKARENLISSHQEYQPIGKSMLNYLYDSKKEDFKQNIQRCLKKESIFEDLVIINHLGKEVYYEVFYYPLLDDENEVIGVTFSYLDITERKTQDQLIKRSESILKGVFESSVQSVFVMDKNRKILRLNKMAQEDIWTNFTQTNLIGQLMDCFITPERLEKFQKNFADCLEGKVVFLDSVQVQYKNYLQYYEVLYYPLMGENKEVIGVVFSYLDITERKKSEYKIRQSEAMLKAVFDSSVQSIFVLGKNAEVLYANKKAFDKTKEILDVEIKIGNSMLEYSNEQDKEPFLANFYKALEGEVVFLERKIAYKKGITLDFEIIYLPIYDREGEIIGVNFSALDITERKQSEQKIKESSEKLAIQGTQIQDYTFLTSHNLRRPLANILGLVSMFNKDNLNDEFNLTILDNLFNSAKELDLIIHQMNAILEQNNYKLNV